MNESTEIFNLYQKGEDHHRSLNMYEEAEKCHNFYIGKQWEGLQAGDEDLPMFNFIKPVGKYKISMIAQNLMNIIYSPMNNNPAAANICSKLSEFAASQWEKNKMDTKAWRIIKNAYITGDHYLYCFDQRKQGDSLAGDLKPRIKTRLINRTNVYFADEQNPDINEQEYIIIAERLPVSKIREIAKENGIGKDEIEMIAADHETDTQIGEKQGQEVKTKLGKCTSLLYMRKTKEGISFSRSTRTVVYQPEKVIKGLDVYPLVGMVWEEQIGSARGVSGVKPLIPNQLLVNKNAARRAISVKRFSFPTAVYDAARIDDIDKLSQCGASVAINNLAGNPINSVIQYLNPSPISSDAEKLQNELINVTRDLEGAGDAATGQIDPTKASGEAIKAVRDQAAVPLNEQIASYKQFVEDLAILWYKMWVVYASDGMEISYEKDGATVNEFISKEILDNLEVDIKIDVSPVDPYSKLSQEMALNNLFDRQQLSFEEYVGALDTSSNVPKHKLEAIIKSRRSNVPDELIQFLQNNPDVLQTVMQYAVQQQGISQDAEGSPGII